MDKLGHNNVKNKDGRNINKVLKHSRHSLWVIYDPGKHGSGIFDGKGATNTGQTKLYWDTLKVSLYVLWELGHFSLLTGSGLTEIFTVG